MATAALAWLHALTAAACRRRVSMVRDRLCGYRPCRRGSVAMRSPHRAGSYPGRFASWSTNHA